MQNNGSHVNKLIDAKLLPSSIEAEQALLGSILIDQEGLLLIIDKLQASDFSTFSNQIIYKTYLELYKDSITIDPVTLKQAIESKNGDNNSKDKVDNLFNKIGGMAYIASLMDGAMRINNLAEYAKIIKDKSQARALIKELYSSLQDCYSSNNPNQLISQLVNKLFSILIDQKEQKEHSILNILLGNINQIQAIADNPLLVRGVATGFIELDRLLTGLKNGDVIVLAARPGVGKTALAMQIARNTSLLTNKMVGFFSLEMSAESVVYRLLSSEARVDSRKFASGELSNDEWLRVAHATEILSDLQILIDDRADVSTSDIKLQVMHWTNKYKKPISLLIVDYLQLMKPTTSRKTDNRRQDVSQISRDIKKLAKELNIPIIVLSSLNRMADGRIDNRPHLSDLRESGDIESDADVVALLYRAEMYEPKPDNLGITEVIIAKNRNGPTDTIEVGFIKQYTKFANMWYDSYTSNRSNVNHSETNNQNEYDAQNSEYVFVD